MSVAAISLPLLGLSAEESSLIDFHVARLLGFRRANAMHTAYYEGRQRVKNLGVNLPPSLRNVESVVGWPATGVDVLEERLDFLGWTSANGDLFGLDDVYTDNSLDVDSSSAHLDSLVAGTGFVIVGTGDVGEPETLITAESPDRVTGVWDGRTRRLSSALSVEDQSDFGDVREVTLYMPYGNIRARNVAGHWRQVERDMHGLGRCQVVMLPNRVRGSRVEGRSEITPAMRAYTDTGVRTMLGMDVHREFYQAPQRYLLGAEAQMFQRGDGSTATGWEMVMGQVLAVPRDEDGELPVIGQFTPSSPAPYLEQMRGLAQMVSAEGAIPANYLGFTSDNPPSADAIRAMEARLIKRAERRQKVFGRGWREVGALALLIREGSIPDEYRGFSPAWADAATPTRAAAADEVSKYVAAGTLPADSVVTYTRMGLSRQEIATLESEKRALRAQARVQMLANATRAPQNGAEGTQEASEQVAA